LRPETPVAAAVEERGEAMGRIRLIAVLNAVGRVSSAESRSTRVASST